MGKEEFLNCWLDRILIKSKSKAFKGSHGFVSTFEVLKQYFKCSDVKFSAINPLDVLRNLPKLFREKAPSLVFGRVLIMSIKPVSKTPTLSFLLNSFSN